MPIKFGNTPFIQYGDNVPRMTDKSGIGGTSIANFRRLHARSQRRQAPPLKFTIATERRRGRTIAVIAGAN
jgi:hypothetical protein